MDISIIECRPSWSQVAGRKLLLRVTMFPKQDYGFPIELHIARYFQMQASSFWLPLLRGVRVLRPGPSRASSVIPLPSLELSGSSEL